MAVRITGNIVEMHILQNGGKVEAYFYRLEEKVPKNILLQFARNEVAKKDIESYCDGEIAHYLSCWDEKDPLPNVSSDRFQKGPIKVRFSLSGSKHKPLISQFNLRNIRNLYADSIELLHDNETV